MREDTPSSSCTTTFLAGAGLARAAYNRIVDVVAAAVALCEGCTCGEASSCYGCLRTYGNQFEHEMLDRSIRRSIPAAPCRVFDIVTKASGRAQRYLLLAPTRLVALRAARAEAPSQRTILAAAAWGTMAGVGWGDSRFFSPDVHGSRAARCLRPRPGISLPRDMTKLPGRPSPHSRASRGSRRGAQQRRQVPGHGEGSWRPTGEPPGTGSTAAGGTVTARAAARKWCNERRAAEVCGS